MQIKSKAKFRCKSGFSLVENIVSIVIILIISVAVYSLMLFASTSFEKSKVLSFVLNDVKNIVNIFSVSNFVQDDNFSINEFKADLNFMYSLNEIDNIVVYNNTNNNHNFTIVKNNDNQLDINGNIKVEISITNENEIATMSAKVSIKNQVIYEKQNLYSKAVAGL